MQDFPKKFKINWKLLIACLYYLRLFELSLSTFLPPTSLLLESLLLQQLLLRLLLSVQSRLVERPISKLLLLVQLGLVARSTSRLLLLIQSIPLLEELTKWLSCASQRNTDSVGVEGYTGQNHSIAIIVQVKRLFSAV